MLVYFFRELIFESKEEYDFKSRKFNSKKVLLFILVMLSFTANMFFVNRIYHLAIDNAKLRKELQSLGHPTNDGKNSSIVPSDSGKVPRKPAASASASRPLDYWVCKINFRTS